MTMYKAEFVHVNVRDGIHMLLKQECCQKEQICLVIEAKNLCCFFRDELVALELAVWLLESKLSKIF
jgi:hypothetical protein